MAKVATATREDCRGPWTLKSTAHMIIVGAKWDTKRISAFQPKVVNADKSITPGGWLRGKAWDSRRQLGVGGLWLV